MKTLTDFAKLLEKLPGQIMDTAMDVVEVELENSVQESFTKEQTPSGVKWKDVKRRDTSSAWLGFDYQSTAAIPSNHPKRKGSPKPYRPRKAAPITNYSPAATKRKILSSGQQQLPRSIKVIKSSTGVQVISDRDYAEIHNKGGQAKIFGKTVSNISARTFADYTPSTHTRVENKLNAFIQKQYNS